jgi:hypothetical protein
VNAYDVRHRDAEESLAAAREAGGASLVLTSPPYPDARSDAQYGATFDTSRAGYRRLGAAVLDALRPGGVCVLNIDGPCRVWRPEIGESERSLIAWEVALDWAALGFRYIDHEAYARDGFPTSSGPRWRSGWEPVHVFSRPGAEPHFDPWAYTRQAKYAGKTTTATGCRKNGETRAVAVKPAVQGDRRRLMSCERWPIHQATTDREHAAPFSSEWADAQVLVRSPLGGLVCDPFVGSGTVALACHRHGRRFVGGDIGCRERDGRRWVDVVSEMLSQETLFPPEAP